MATHTTNYNLSKPEASDAFSAFRQSYNDNMDIIDANLGGGGGGGSVNDVEVNGVSVVVGGVAEVTVPTQTSDLNNDSGFLTSSDVSAVAMSGDYDDLLNKPTIPTATSDLVNDSDFVSDASYVHTDNNFTTALKDKLDGIEAGAEVNVQADWNEADSTDDAFIKNKPTIPTATSDLVNDSGFTAVSVTQIQSTGTKIAEVEVDGVTTELYAPTGGGFSALLVITAGTGLTVTASKGGDTYTATEISTGTYEVSVDSAGTWTASDGSNTATVAVSASTTYYVTLSSVPEGSTVTPTDDISIWLACGQRTENYTTLAEVLNDSVCLSALISDSNAVDYLVRSTTWASGITANSFAMSYIGLNNYASNTLLTDSTWITAICQSAYKESILNVKVPAMTSNNTPSGVASASRIISATYDAYKAFDRNNDSIWASGSGDPANRFISYTFPSITKIYMMTLKIYYTGGYGYLKDFIIVDDNNNILLTATSANNDTLQEFIFDVAGNSAKYQLNTVSVNYANNYDMEIYEIQFYGRADI